MRTRTSTAGNEGFTLLELLIVLALIGLAGSVVFFSSGRLYEKTVFNGEARRIFQALKHARELALFERRDMTFRVDEDSGTYRIEGIGKTVYSHAARSGITISGKEIVFFSKGNSSGGQISISNGKGRTYYIDVDPVLGTPVFRRF